MMRSLEETGQLWGGKGSGYPTIVMGSAPNSELRGAAERWKAERPGPRKCMSRSGREHGR